MKIFIILTSLLMATCDGSSTDANYDSSLQAEIEVEIPPTEQPPPPPDSKQVLEIQQKAVKTGGLSYSVDNIQEEYSRIRLLLKNNGAYISSENERKEYDRITQGLKINVPPSHFDTLMVAISKGKKLDHRWINIDDVTGEYYDLQSRITNKEKLEERYQVILKQANNVSDLLEVERNLNQARSDMDILQGQYKRLNNKIKFSAIQVYFHELTPYTSNQSNLSPRLLNAISEGGQGFLSFMIYLLTLWPFGLLILGIMWVVKRRRLKRKSNL